MGNTKQRIGEVSLKGYRCRCGHEWMARDEERPLVCPKCKSARWDKPYKFRRKQNNDTVRETKGRENE
jgi:predicted Zn-ribbon and HTH transcriptional regulator